MAGGHLELADVVEERRPAQPVATAVGHLELVREQVGEDTHPLGVPARRLVVHAQGEHQLDDRLHPACVVLMAGLVGAPQALLQVARAAGAPRHRESCGRLVGEDQRQVEERGQREEAAGGALEGDQGHQRGRGDEPTDSDGGRDAVSARQQVVSRAATPKEAAIGPAKTVTRTARLRPGRLSHSRLRRICASLSPCWRVPMSFRFLCS